MAKADRDAVLEILRETKPEFATWLKAANWGPSVKMTVRAK